MRREYFKVLKATIFVIFAAAMFIIRTQPAAAFTIQSPGTGLAGLSNTNTSVDEVVSYCAPQDPGEEASVPCQAETLNQNSYFDIWEDENAQGGANAINVNVTYSCLTGFEDFQITSEVNTLVRDSAQCNGEAEGQDYAGNGTTGTAKFSVTPSSCNEKDYGTTECEVVVELSAEVPAQGAGSGEYCDNKDSKSNCTGLDGGYYIGGSVEADLSVSGNNNDIYQAASTETGGSKPVSSNGRDALTGGGWDTSCGNGACARQFGEIEHSSGGNLSFTFQVPCNYAGGTAYLAWEGVAWALMNGGASWTLSDDGTGWSPSGSPDVNGAMTPEPNLGNGQTAEDWYAQSNVRTDMNTVYDFGFTPTAGHTYTWTWNFGSTNNISDNITYSVPFEMNSVDSGGNSSLGCPNPNTNTNTWTLKGNTKVATNGNSAQFNSEIGNEGPDTASYTWKVQGCYYTNNNSGYCGSSPTNANWYKDCTGDTNSSGVDTNNGARICGNQSTLPISTTFESPYTCAAGSTSSPNYCPDYAGNKAMVNYTFPSSAKSGDGYCERIYYTDDDGPTDTDVAVSLPACFSFGSPPPQTGFTCASATFNTGSSGLGDTTVRYIVYATTNGSPSNTEYSTGQYLPAAPGGASDDAASQPNYSRKQSTGQWSSPYPYPALDSANEVDNSNGQAALNTQKTYPLTASQLLSGNVTWHVVTYNYVTNQPTGGSPGQYSAYYSDNVYIDSYSTNTVTGCFQARCSITVNGSLGGANTEVGSQFTYTVIVKNIGSNELYDPGPLSGGSTNLAATPSYVDPSNPLEDDVGGSLLPGQSSQQLYFKTKAPNTLGTNLIGAIVGYPGIANLVNIGSCNSQPSPGGVCAADNCGIPTTTYEPFTLTPTAVNCTINCDPEDPTYVNYATYVTSTNTATTVPVPATTRSTVYFVPVGGGTTYHVNTVDTRSFDNSNPADIANYILPANSADTWTPPEPYAAGDKACTEIDITTATGGEVDATGDIIDGTYNNPDAISCVNVHNEPYLQVFGNDVIGDAAFSPECGSNGDTTDSGIYTYSHATNGAGANADAQPTGSYTQFGAQALNVIYGMASAGLRNGSDPVGSMGLSFSNDSDNTGDTGDAAELGGGFGAIGCEPDFYSEKPSTTTQYTGASIGDIETSTTGDDDFSAGDGSDTTTIGTTGGIIIPDGVKVAIFVDGNAYIDSNIKYENASSGWSTIKKIPSFYIIATGNIYIDPSVTNLDGVYIAEPNSGTATGIVDSCATGSGQLPVSELYGDSQGCDQQLVVNGAFVDQATVLDRSFSSLRYSQKDGTENENPQATSTHACGTPNSDINNNYGSSATFYSCAAEVFNFSPEVYMSQPALNPLPQEYEYVTSLSPIL